MYLRIRHQRHPFFKYKVKAIAYAHKFLKYSNNIGDARVVYLNRSFEIFDTITCLHSYRILYKM